MFTYKTFRILGKFVSLSWYKKFVKFWRYYFVGLLHRADEHHIFLSGGGIAYSLFLSMIPLVLIVFAILGSIIEQGAIEEQVIKLIDTLIPYPAYADYTKQVILSRIPDVIEYKTIAGYIGAFGLFFTSTWLFSSIRTILNRIFGVTDDKGAIVGLLRDFGMVLLLIILVLLATFIIPTLNLLNAAAHRIELLQMFRLSEFLDWIFPLLSVIILYFMFFIFYYLIPYEKLGKKIPALSAFWATLFWEIARNIFGYYISNFLYSNKIYGPFILFIGVLFWIFYSSCLFILAAEIGQLYRERQALKEMQRSSHEAT